MVTDNYMFEKILQKIDHFDKKLDTKIDRVYNDIMECKDDINLCKIDIQGVQKDLTNHLNNKKEETKSYNMRTRIAFSIIGILFTAYITIKELL